MATIKFFEDIMAWKKARELCQGIFVEILNKKEIRDYKLKDQINAASGSVMDNIAEGFGRGGNKELRQFLSIARASCSEVKSQLYRARDRTYISEEVFLKLAAESDEIGKLITGFMEYLKKTEIKGSKYKL